MKVLVAYDGTLQAKDALRYGMEKVEKVGGEVIALHIFNDNLFVDYGIAPKEVERARAEFAGYVEEAKRIIREPESGVRGSVFVGEGDPEEECIRFAKERNVDLLLCPPRYKSLAKKFRKVAEENGRAARENTILDETEKLRMSMVSFQ